MNKIKCYFLSSICLVALNNGYSAIAEEEISITHQFNSELNLSEIESRLRSSNNLVLPLEEELKLLKSLSEFELGKFLLSNRGLNGFWTSYLILKAPKETLENPLEDWLVNNAPAFKATRERAHIFAEQINRYVTHNNRVATIPCGTMEDLYSLNLEGVHDIKFVGMDIDLGSLEFAKTAYKPNKNCSIELIRKDAWAMDLEDEFAIVVSKKTNKSAVVRNRIRRRFYASLKPHLNSRGLFVIFVYSDNFKNIKFSVIETNISRLFKKSM